MKGMSSTTIALIVGAAVIMMVGLIVSFIGQGSLLDFSDDAQSQKNSKCWFQINQIQKPSSTMSVEDIDSWCKSDKASEAVSDKIAYLKTGQNFLP